MAEPVRWWRWLQVALALAVITYTVVAVRDGWLEFRDQPIAWQLNPVWLLLSLALVWLSYAVLTEGWRRVVLGMQQRLTFLAAARICMVSNLGKYLPGKVWALAGAAMLAQRAGVEPAAAVAASFILQALSLAGGLVLVALLAPEAIGAIGAGGRVVLLVLATAAFAGLLVFAVPALLERIRRWLPASLAGIAPVPPGPLLLGFAANLLGWCLYGLAFQSLIRGLTPSTQVSWAQATAVFTASYLIGLVAAFAPGGLGPREAAFILLLSPATGPKLAAALAIATRLQLTITELGAALPFLPALRRSSQAS